MKSNGAATLLEVKHILRQGCCSSKPHFRLIHYQPFHHSTGTGCPVIRKWPTTTAFNPHILLGDCQVFISFVANVTNAFACMQVALWFQLCSPHYWNMKVTSHLQAVKSVVSPSSLLLNCQQRWAGLIIPKCVRSLAQTLDFTLSHHRSIFLGTFIGFSSHPWPLKSNFLPFPSNLSAYTHDHLQKMPRIWPPFTTSTVTTTVKSLYRILSHMVFVQLSANLHPVPFSSHQSSKNDPMHNPCNVLSAPLIPQWLLISLRITGFGFWDTVSRHSEGWPWTCYAASVAWNP